MHVSALPRLPASRFLLIPSPAGFGSDTISHQTSAPMQSSSPTRTTTTMVANPRGELCLGHRTRLSCASLAPISLATLRWSDTPGNTPTRGGKEFGQINTIWLLKVGGLRIVHLGDNGPLTEGAAGAIDHVDVLMMPIDSQYHILKADQI